MSITGETGGERLEDAGSTPSISGKRGIPAMSVASSSALLEVPMSGDAGGDGMSVETLVLVVENRLAMPRRRQKAAMVESEGMASPRGMEPSVRISLRSDYSERFRSRWGSGGTIHMICILVTLCTHPAVGHHLSTICDNECTLTSIVLLLNTKNFV